MMKPRYSLMMVMLVSVLTAACTLSLTSPQTPTAVTGSGQSADGGQSGGQTGGLSDADATMAALGTSLAATQQSQQSGGGGQTANPTPASPDTGGAVATATPSPVAAQASPTPAPLVATATAIQQPATPTKVAATGACTSPYTVQRGDWIFKIARACNLTPQAIIAANPGINPNRLEVGQKLNLPGVAGGPTAPPATTAPQACKGSYTVKAGDNLFRIGYNCGFTTEQMARKNNIAPPYRIFPGQVLQYP
jgi:LysM repeat protein